MPQEMAVTGNDSGLNKGDYGMEHNIQASMEAAIAKNEVEHLNAKRIQDEVEDLKEAGYMGFGQGFNNNCNGMGEGLLFGMLASGGHGWGRGGGSSSCGCNGSHDLVELLRDGHEGVLSMKDDVNRNSLREADIRHEDAMRFQHGLDKNESKTIEMAFSLERDMALGFKDMGDKLCRLEKDTLKRELDDCYRKLSDEKDEKLELRAVIREGKQTQAFIEAVNKIAGR